MLSEAPVQVLVNNAGLHVDAPLAGMTQPQWTQVLGVNLNGFFNVTQPLLLPMIRTRWGRVISISSVSALIGNRGQANYAAAKAGLHGATRSLALEVATRGITVNVGKISGGIGKNTIPDAAEAQVDFRFVTPGSGEEMERAFRNAAAVAAAGVAGSKVEVSGGVKRQPLQRTPESVQLMEAYAECARAAGLGGAESPLLGGGSDANTTSAAGVPSIDGLGPRGKGFHTNDEQIERATLLPKTEALIRFLLTA